MLAVVIIIIMTYLKAICWDFCIKSSSRTLVLTFLVSTAKQEEVNLCVSVACGHHVCSSVRTPLSQMGLFLDACKKIYIIHTVNNRYCTGFCFIDNVFILYAQKWPRTESVGRFCYCSCCCCPRAWRARQTSSCSSRTSEFRLCSFIPCMRKTYTRECSRDPSVTFTRRETAFCTSL